MIFDEVQHAPGLLPYIKGKIDAERNRKGQYLLTGSQHILVMEEVTESLAGRTAVLKLLPLSRREAEGRPESRLPWQTAKCRPANAVTAVSGSRLWQDLLRGSYPEPVAEQDRDIQLRIVPIEVKLSSTPQPAMAKSIRSFQEHIGDLGAGAYIVHPGGERLPIAPGVTALPFGEL